MFWSILGALAFFFIVLPALAQLGVITYGAGSALKQVRRERNLSRFERRVQL